MVKIGIISFAHMHAYSYAEQLQRLAASGEDVLLTAVADEDAVRGEKAAQQFGTAYYQDYERLLATDVDAVIVCTENAKHHDVVLAAARAGKHVLCEKPIATNTEDAKQMIEECKRNGVILQIAFPVRFNTPIRRLKQMCDNGELGRIVAMRGTNRGQNPGGWFVDNTLAGGGAVLDHTVHVVDIMRWLLGSEVREVFAEVDTHYSDIPTDDSGLLMLEFENGVFASHDPSWSRPKTNPTWGDVTIEVIGTAGTIRVDAYAQHLNLYSDVDGRYSHQLWGDDMDFELVADFVASVREGRVPSITGEDGLRALEVALAAYESGRTHQPVVLR